MIHRVGIIICDRYRTCAGGKCLRAMRRREGAFERYRDEQVELVGYTTCGGCPGGNIEYAPAELQKNGATVIHLATGFVVGYPPCPHIEHFRDFVEARYGIEVVVGTHPIPQTYFELHSRLASWGGESWPALIEPTVVDEATRRAYDGPLSS